MVSLKTPEQVRAEFRRMGVSVKDWAAANDVSEAAVHRALRGERACIRGASHKAAVLLGLKQGVLPPQNLADLRFSPLSETQSQQPSVGTAKA